MLKEIVLPPIDMKNFSDQPIDSNLIIMSHDFNVNELVIPFYEANVFDTYEAFYSFQGNTSIIIQEVYNQNNEIRIPIVNDVRRHKGIFTIELNASSASTQATLLKLNVMVKRSNIDSNSEFLFNHYYKLFEDYEKEIAELNNATQATIKTQLKQSQDNLQKVTKTLIAINDKVMVVNDTADGFITDVATKQADVTSKYNAFDTDITEANQTIDELLALQPQFQAVLDETTGKDVISAPEIILARNGEIDLKTRLDKEKQEVTAQLTQITQEVDITVTVGTGGDFYTINQAINHLSKKNKQNDKKADIKLLSGFVMQEQVLVNGDNLSWITITSEDNKVMVNVLNPEPKIILPAYGEYVPTSVTSLFNAHNNGILPVIDVLFDMSTTEKTGLNAFAVVDGGTIKINPNKGCINSRSNGIYALQGGKVYAMGANLSHANGHAVACFRASYVNFGGGDGSYAGGSGAYVDVLGVFNADSADLSHATQNGIWADQASMITCVYGDVSNAGTVGINLNLGSQASVRGVIADNCANYGIRGSGSLIDATDASAKNCQTGIFSQHGATINAHNADVTGYSTNGLHATNGGYISARDAKTEKIIGTQSSNDMRVSANGIINANSASGGYNNSKANVFNANGAILNSEPTTYGFEFENEQTITLSNGWSGTLKASKTSEGLVSVKGQNITVGTATKFTTIGTLPSAFRPTLNTGLQGLHASNGGLYGFLINSITGDIQTGEEVDTGNINFNFTYRL